MVVLQLIPCFPHVSILVFPFVSLKDCFLVFVCCGCGRSPPLSPGWSQMKPICCSSIHLPSISPSAFLHINPGLAPAPWQIVDSATVRTAWTLILWISNLFLSPFCNLWSSCAQVQSDRHDLLPGLFSTNHLQTAHIPCLHSLRPFRKNKSPTIANFSLRLHFSLFLSYDNPISSSHQYFFCFWCKPLALSVYPSMYFFLFLKTGKINFKWIIEINIWLLLPIAGSYQNTSLK